MGLLSYPFLVEPLLPLQSQAELWSAAFVLYALGFAGCGFLLLRAPRTSAASATLRSARATAASSTAFRRGDAALWILLPACASVVLLATTNQLCDRQSWPIQSASLG